MSGVLTIPPRTGATFKISGEIRDKDAALVDSSVTVQTRIFTASNASSLLSVKSSCGPPLNLAGQCTLLNPAGDLFKAIYEISLTFELAGTYYIELSLPLYGVVKKLNSFSITVEGPGPYSQMVVLQQPPAQLTAGNLITPPLKVGMADQYGNLFTTPADVEGFFLISSGVSKPLMSRTSETIPVGGLVISNISLTTIEPSAVTVGCRTTRLLSFVSSPPHLPLATFCAVAGLISLPAACHDDACP